MLQVLQSCELVKAVILLDTISCPNGWLKHTGYISGSVILFVSAYVNIT
jgi:hypothetical protein